MQSLDHAVRAQPVKGALGTPEAPVGVISGHDTNLANLSGMLRLSWALPSHQPDDAPPGGALIFSLWKSTSTGRYSVRLQFVAQTLDQMHAATPLSVANPPPIANLFVPGCSTSTVGYACDWTSFVRTATAAIAPEFVEK